MQDKLVDKVSLEKFKILIDFVHSLILEGKFRIVTKKPIAINFDQAIFDKKANDMGISKEQVKDFFNQLLFMVTALCENDKVRAEQWLLDNAKESEEEVEIKFNLVEPLVTNEDKMQRIFYNSHVFKYIKSFAWGLEEKYLEVTKSDLKYKVGVVNMIIKENNPFLKGEQSDQSNQSILINLTLDDVNTLLNYFTSIKENLQKK